MSATTTLTPSRVAEVLKNKTPAGKRKLTNIICNAIKAHVEKTQNRDAIVAEMVKLVEELNAPQGIPSDVLMSFRALVGKRTTEINAAIGSTAYQPISDYMQPYSPSKPEGMSGLLVANVLHVLLNDMDKTLIVSQSTNAFEAHAINQAYRIFPANLLTQLENANADYSDALSETQKSLFTGSGAFAQIASATNSKVKAMLSNPVLVSHFAGFSPAVRLAWGLVQPWNSSMFTHSKSEYLYAFAGDRLIGSIEQAKVDKYIQAGKAVDANLPFADKTHKANGPSIQIAIMSPRLVYYMITRLIEQQISLGLVHRKINRDANPTGAPVPPTYEIDMESALFRVMCTAHVSRLATSPVRVYKNSTKEPTSFKKAFDIAMADSLTKAKAAKAGASDDASKAKNTAKISITTNRLAADLTSMLYLAPYDPTPIDKPAGGRTKAAKLSDEEVTLNMLPLTDLVTHQSGVSLFGYVVAAKDYALAGSKKTKAPLQPKNAKILELAMEQWAAANSSGGDAAAAATAKEMEINRLIERSFVVSLHARMEDLVHHFQITGTSATQYNTVKRQGTSNTTA
jgi:hypothetical protein